MYELFSKKDYIDLVIISDLHLCNKLDRMDLLYKAYDYSYKNNIKYIINLGDLFDSCMPHNKNELRIKSLSEQLEFVINNYPYSKDIKTLILYGNHDYYSKQKNNIDIVEKFSKERKDLIHLGYGESYINIKDNFIKLQHEIDYLKNYKKNLETYITLLGHYHSYKVKTVDGSTYIYVPSLSNLKTGDNNPSILHIQIQFRNELFSNLDIKCINMDTNIITSEFDIAVTVKQKKYQIIKNELNK